MALEIIRSEALESAVNSHSGIFQRGAVYRPPHARSTWGNLSSRNNVYVSPEINKGGFKANFTQSSCHSCDGNGLKHKKQNQNQEISIAVAAVSPVMAKYFRQRYELFSRFDHGIQMDEEGWFSVTPELIAKHQASRCQGEVVVDWFAGVGGNVIQFAHKCRRVVAIDIDSRKIDYARHNAAVYGVEDRIQFFAGDCILLGPKFKADTIFLSPPWGGPDYVKANVFDINLMLRPYSGRFLFNLAKTIARKIVMFLPRNVDAEQLEELALSANPPWSLEVEKNYLNGKLKAITAYFTQSIM